MQFFTRITIAITLLSLPACGGDTTKTETKVTKTTTKTVTPTSPDGKTAGKTETTTETKTETKTVVAPEADKPEAGPPAADSPEGKVLLAAMVAREISSAPDRADEILGKHGLDRDRLDALMFEIAGDPALTSAYMAARRTS